MTFRSILVPLDESQFGEYALPHALSLARRAGARLTLAHVSEPPHYSEISLATAVRDENAAAEKGRVYIEEVSRRVRTAAPSVEVASTLLRGRVTDALCEFVDRSNPDLVVLTTHGRGPLSRFWFGSVATELVQRSPAPLLLVRPKEGEPDLSADPVPQRILIPLDGSPFGEHVIPLATAVGALTGATYRLLRVTPPILMGGWDTPATLPAGARAVSEQLESEARSYHTDLVRRSPALGAAETQVAVDWPPAGAILADADASGIDLVAMETRGHSGLVRLLLGSVADKVVRGATVPVLLRRPEGEARD